MGSTLGRLFRVTTFGESHGVGLGAVVENIPAGLALSEEDIQIELDRRKPGQSRVSTPRKEDDRVTILSGVFEGRTIGSPVAMLVYNENAREKDYSDFSNVYRPSHADYTYHARYGHRTYRGGGRASARSTIGVVAAGAIARKLLRELAGVKIAAYVSSVHKIIAPDYLSFGADAIREKAESNDVRVPDAELAESMAKSIHDARQSGDSLGGTVSLLVENLPAGIGDPVFDRLDALLAQAMMAIPATKGIEIGSGFSGTEMTGFAHNDEFYMEDGRIRTRTNRSGGIQGGISNGEPITMRIAFKPTATISREQKSVNEKGEEVNLSVRGRHDPCVLPRAVPIVEAMAAIVLADQFLISQTARIDRLKDQP